MFSNVIESESFKLPIKQLIGLASDDVGVLFPPHNGVIALLPEKGSY